MTTLSEIRVYEDFSINLTTERSEVRVCFANGRKQAIKIPHPATPKQVAMRLRQLADNIEHDTELQA